MFAKLKQLFSGENRQKTLNLIYSVGAAAVFNMVLQFLVYPGFERSGGSAQFGVVQAIISLVAIVAGTCGYAVNCARLLGREKGRTANGDYNTILAVLGGIGALIGVGYLAWLQQDLQTAVITPLSYVLVVLLMVATMLRYYSEVEYRLSTDFFRYMIYYLLIAAGYLVGLAIFHLTGEWMLTLLLGELACLVYVCIHGSIYRRPLFRTTPELKPILYSIGFVFASALVDNLTLHADRIVLLAITGDGDTVTYYYIASLVGKIISMLTLPINALLLSYLVRYQGGLTKKLWLMLAGGATAFGLVGFVGCLIVSPILIGILYPDLAAQVAPYVTSAILGQIFYFISGMLMIILLRFKGERKQLLFNGIYAVEFFTCVVIGTLLDGLDGFVYAILIANAIRFVMALAWGFIGKSTPTAPEQEVPAKK